MEKLINSSTPSQLRSSSEQSETSSSDSGAPNRELLCGSVGHKKIELTDSGLSNVSNQLSKRGIPTSLNLALNLTALSEPKSMPVVIIRHCRNNAGKISSDSERTMSLSPSYLESGESSPGSKSFDDLTREQKERFMATMYSWKDMLCKKVEGFEKNELVMQMTVSKEIEIINREAYKYGDAELALEQVTQAKMNLAKLYFDALAELQKDRKSPQNSPNVRSDRTMEELSSGGIDLESLKEKMVVGLGESKKYPIGSEERKKEVLAQLFGVKKVSKHEPPSSSMSTEDRGTDNIKRYLENIGPPKK